MKPGPYLTNRKKLTQEKRIYLEAIRYLLSGNAEPALTTFASNSYLLNLNPAQSLILPLMACASKDKPCHEDVFKWILKHTTNVNQYAANKRSAVIHWLTTLNYDHFLKLLLENKSSIADVNLLAENDESPVYIACFSGAKECLQRLIEAKADIHIPNAQGTTPLMVACAEGHVDCVKLLLKNGARVDATDNEGKTAYHYIAKSQSKEIFNLLRLADKKSLNKTSNLDNKPSDVADNMGSGKYKRLLDKKAGQVTSLTQLCVEAICFHFKQDNAKTFKQTILPANYNHILPEEMIDFIEQTWCLKTTCKLKI